MQGLLTVLEMIAVERPVMRQMLEVQCYRITVHTVLVLAPWP
jgi:hypothetical protein